MLPIENRRGGGGCRGEEPKSIGSRGKFTGRWNYFFAEGMDGVGILPRRNAIHKILKFLHVVSHEAAESSGLRAASV